MLRILGGVNLSGVLFVSEGGRGRVGFVKMTFFRCGCKAGTQEGASEWCCYGSNCHHLEETTSGMRFVLV